jgi:hypothetical protein
MTKWTEIVLMIQAASKDEVSVTRLKRFDRTTDAIVLERGLNADSDIQLRAWINRLPIDRQQELNDEFVAAFRVMLEKHPGLADRFAPLAFRADWTGAELVAEVVKYIDELAKRSTRC